MECDSPRERNETLIYPIHVIPTERKWAQKATYYVIAFTQKSQSKQIHGNRKVDVLAARGQGKKRIRSSCLREIGFPYGVMKMY